VEKSPFQHEQHEENEVEEPQNVKESDAGVTGMIMLAIFIVVVTVLAFK